MKPYYERYWKNQDVLEDFPYKWPVIKHFIPTKPKIKILDFGCGKGTIFKELVTINTRATVIGVDVSKLAIRENRKRFKDNKFYVIKDGGRLPFPNNTFDFILASDVLEHIYDTENAFSELSRILKPQGQILISVPYNGQIKRTMIALFFFDMIFDPTTPHIRFFTKKSMTKYLNKVKINVIKVGYYGRFYPLSNGMYLLAEKK